MLSNNNNISAKLIITKYLFFIYVILLTCGCSKSGSSPDQGGNSPPPPQIEYFPNKVNDQWIYDFIDSSDIDNITTQILTVTSVAIVHLQLDNGPLGLGDKVVGTV